MNAETRTFKFEGIVHCHTNLSSDCNVNLPELCSALRSRGFSFVALTDHATGVSADRYQAFVDECRSASNELFVVIPGLEFLCSGGIEIAGIGVPKPVSAQDPQEVVAQIRRLGGYAVWVHPLKRGRWTGPFLDCDAVEVLNGKVDGTLAPDLSLLGRVKKSMRHGNRHHVIFGLDLHHLELPCDVWVECEAPNLTAEAIVKALRNGSFCSRTRYAAVSSSGDTRLRHRLLVPVVRFAYVAWNFLLARLPDFARQFVVRSSRPVVRAIKGRPSDGLNSAP